MCSSIESPRCRLLVQRTINGRGVVAPSKNGKERRVKASPALLRALRSHLEAVDLDGSLGLTIPRSVLLRADQIIE